MKDEFEEVRTRLYPKNSNNTMKSVSASDINVPKKINAVRRGRKPKALQKWSQSPLQSELKSEIEFSSSEDELDDDGDSSLLTANHRKRKSILQLTGSKFSRKAAGRRKSILATNSIEKIEDGDEKDEHSGDVPLLPQGNSQLLPEGHRSAKSSSQTRVSQSQLGSVPSLYHDYPARRFYGLKIAEYDLPSCRPQGPGDLWTCTFEDCDHRIYEASTPTGFIRVKEHFQLHAHQAQEKIDLAYKESRPYLPVQYVYSSIMKEK